jgi:hypothetical protein
VRILIFLLLWPIVKVLSLASHMEREPDSQSVGFLSRSAAEAAATLFIVGTGWGGDDTALQMVEADRRLFNSVLATARLPQHAGPRSNVSFLAQVLGDGPGR